jgi:peptidoglycan/xylan/chitin deacetylase (PgdA/CDA1 family)
MHTQRPGIARASLLLALIILGAAVAQAENLAITFDDLPLNGTLAPAMTRAGIVKQVLAVLKKQRVPQVYGFVNAKGLEDTPDGAEALRLWVAGGERVGNHTYSHFDLTNISAAEFLEDLRRNEPVLELLDPGGHWKWLRYPFLREGDTLEKRRAVRAGLQERGYRIAQVTQDYEDYLWNSPFARCAAQHDEASITWLRSTYLEFAERYLDAGRQGARMVFDREIPHVLLLHLGAFSPRILPDLLELLRRKGFNLVTLEQVESDPVYESDPDAGNKYGGSLLEQYYDARHLKYPPAGNKPYKELEAVCQRTAATPQETR